MTAKLLVAINAGAKYVVNGILIIIIIVIIIIIIIRVSELERGGKESGLRNGYGHATVNERTKIVAVRETVAKKLSGNDTNCDTNTNKTIELLAQYSDIMVDFTPTVWGMLVFLTSILCNA